MKRRDRTVLAVSTVLALVAVAAVAFSLLVLDRRTQPSQMAADSTSSLLVVTWAPSLCKVEPSNSGCRSGHVGKLGQSFMLHGLWPQPSTEQYCDVPERAPDKSRSPVSLPEDLKANLQALMSDSNRMTTHEWYAHGTCSGVAPPEYFSIAAQLAEQASAVLEPVFARSAGGQLTSRSVRDAFDARFGSGVGTRIALSCRDTRGQGNVVYEVRLSLPPVVALEKSSSLAAALAAGPTVAPGCSKASVP
jgi:ribonuclease T2